MTTTTYISLLDAEAQAGPSRFAVPAPDSSTTLQDVVHSLRRAKRIVAICVSTAASIPDFRGSTGLFSSSRKGKAPMKDLFHVKSLASPALLAAHHELITELASLAHSASPTAFHRFMNDLDKEGRLLRVYTQNIDGLDEKAGLRVGIPPKTLPKRKLKSPMMAETPPSPVTPSKEGGETDSVTPRVIPLHGMLSSMRCTLCDLKTPLLPHLPLPPTAIPCPTCEFTSSIRSALSERSRRSGTLRPDVVLYGEEHAQGDHIGSLVERDLKGTGGKSKEGKVDFLIVAGTTLAIPGVKRIVKEMAKAVHGRGKGKEVKSVFVNDESPKNPGEWAGVFDLWVQGDIQDFVEVIQNAPATPVAVKTPTKVKVEKIKMEKGLVTPHKEPITPKKKRTIMPLTPESLPRPTVTGRKLAPGRENSAMALEELVDHWLPTPRSTPQSLDRKRKVSMGEHDTTPTKRAKIDSWSTSSSSDLTDIADEV